MVQTFGLIMLKSLSRNGQATLSQIITVRDDIMNYLIDQGLDNSDAFKIMEFVRKGKPKKNLKLGKLF